MNFLTMDNTFKLMVLGALGEVSVSRHCPFKPTQFWFSVAELVTAIYMIPEETKAHCFAYREYVSVKWIDF